MDSFVSFVRWRLRSVNAGRAGVGDAGGALARRGGILAPREYRPVREESPRRREV